MVRKAFLLSETFREPLSLGNDEMDNKCNSLSSIEEKMKNFNKIFKTERRIITSMSLNCLNNTQNETIFNESKVIENSNDTVNSDLLNGLYNRRCNSFNEIYFLKKSDGNIEVETGLLHQKKALSASKVEKCVRFNDNISIKELNDEYDRRPMPLAKMYYKDQVELSQLREEMKQIQYRVMNKIEGKVLLGN